MRMVFHCRGCFSGIIAKEAKNHPAWERSLAEACAGLGVYGYEYPTSPENFTAITMDVFVENMPRTLRIFLCLTRFLFFAQFLRFRFGPMITVLALISLLQCEWSVGTAVRSGILDKSLSNDQGKPC